MTPYRLKRFLPVLLAVFALCVVLCAVTAAAEEYGSFVYKLVEPEEGEDFEPYVRIVSYRHDRTDESTVVHMPEEIESAPVKVIGDGAFRGAGITDVILPESLEVIGSAAFFDCDELTFVLFPDSVREIGDSAFQSCDALRYVRLGHGAERIGALAFRECASLEAADLGDHVSVIDDGAFYGCPQLKSIFIPQSVKSIGGMALGLEQNGDWPKVVDGFSFCRSGSVPALDAYIAEPVAAGGASTINYGTVKTVTICGGDAHQGDYTLVRTATDTYDGVELAVCSVCGSVLTKANTDVPEGERNITGLVIFIIAIALVLGFAGLTVWYVRRSKARRAAAVEAYMPEEAENREEDKQEEENKQDAP